MKNKFIISLLLLIVVLLLYQMFVLKAPFVRLGSPDYNRIESGITNDKVHVNSTSSTLILSNNSGKVYDRLCNNASSTQPYYDVWLTAATSSDVAVAVAGYGTLLSARECLSIGPDNLIITSIYGIARDLPVDVSIWSK